MWQQGSSSRGYLIRELEYGFDYIALRGFRSWLVVRFFKEYIAVLHPNEYRYVYPAEYPIISMSDGTRWVNMPDLKAFMDEQEYKWNARIADLVYPGRHCRFW